MNIKFVLLFCVFVVLELLDALTSHLCYAAGLIAWEMNLFAVYLMEHEILILGKIVLILVVGALCYILRRENDQKWAVRGLSMGIVICVVANLMNAISLWRVSLI